MKSICSFTPWLDKPSHDRKVASSSIPSKVNVSVSVWVLDENPNLLQVYQEAHHALWSLWCSVAILRNLQSECLITVCIMVVECKTQNSKCICAHTPSLPHFSVFPASHRWEFYTWGNHNSFYFGTVCKINNVLIIMSLNLSHIVFWEKSHSLVHWQI